MKTINTSTAAAVALKGTIDEKNNFNHKMITELEELFGINTTKDAVQGIVEANNTYESPLSLASVMKEAEKYFKGVA